MKMSHNIFHFSQFRLQLVLYPLTLTTISELISVHEKRAHCDISAVYFCNRKKLDQRTQKPLLRLLPPRRFHGNDIVSYDLTHISQMRVFLFWRHVITKLIWHTGFLVSSNNEHFCSDIFFYHKIERYLLK